MKNQAPRESLVKSLTEDEDDSAPKKNKTMKETILDLHDCSMPDTPLANHLLARRPNLMPDCLLWSPYSTQSTIKFKNIYIYIIYTYHLINSLINRTYAAGGVWNCPLAVLCFDHID